MLPAWEDYASISSAGGRSGKVVILVSSDLAAPMLLIVACPVSILSCFLSCVEMPYSTNEYYVARE